MPDPSVYQLLSLYEPLFKPAEPVDITQMARQWATAQGGAAEAQQREAQARIWEQRAAQQQQQQQLLEETFGQPGATPPFEEVAQRMIGVALQTGDIDSVEKLLGMMQYQRQLDMQQRGLDQEEQPKPPKTGVSGGYFYRQDPLTGEAEIVGKLPERVRAEKTSAMSGVAKGKGKTLAEQLEELRGGKATGEQKTAIFYGKKYRAGAKGWELAE